MPHLVRQHQPQVIAGVVGTAPTVRTSQDLIEQHGPIIQVTLSVTDAIADELASKGIPIPSPITGFALIDTGASGTGIDQSAVAALKLPVIDRIEYLTPSTPHGQKEQATRHPVNVTVLGVDWKFDAIATEHKLGAQNLLLLIGRDVLRNVHFTYHGEFGFFTVSM